MACCEIASAPLPSEILLGIHAVVWILSSHTEPRVHVIRRLLVMMVRMMI